MLKRKIAWGKVISSASPEKKEEEKRPVVEKTISRVAVIQHQRSSNHFFPFSIHQQFMELFRHLFNCNYRNGFFMRARIALLKEPNKDGTNNLLVTLRGCTAKENGIKLSQVEAVVDQLVI